MKKTLTTLAILASFTAFAQVGINVNESNIADDALLHIKNKTGENKGVVLPSVSLNNDTQILNGSSNTEGLLVWNTGGSLAKGYYYWDGASWATVGAGQKEIGAVYEKVRVYRGATFSASDIQDDDYILVFTDAEGFAMPTVTDKYKNRTICIRNATSVNFGTGAKQVVMSNVISGQETINSGFTRCYTSFEDTDDGQWKWISTSL